MGCCKEFKRSVGQRDPGTLTLREIREMLDGKRGNVKKHGVEVGLPDELFDPPKQRIFPVLSLDFKEVIPVLLVSLLGSIGRARDVIVP